MNLLLLCHGALKEFSTFTLAQGQTVQYRGNYGTALTGGQARAIVQALLDNPLVSDEEIGRQIFSYQPQEPLVGPGSFAPDISLSGDDRLLCLALNLVTRRWVQLRHDWHSTLGRVAAASGQPVSIDLLCCTVLVNAEVARAVVDPKLEVRAWSDVLH